MVKSVNERNPYLLFLNSYLFIRYLPRITRMKVRMTTNLHDLNNLGCTRVTKIRTVRSYFAKKRNTLNFIWFRLKTVTRFYEVGIASNRKLECYGEIIT